MVYHLSYISLQLSTICEAFTHLIDRAHLFGKPQAKAQWWPICIAAAGGTIKSFIVMLLMGWLGVFGLCLGQPSHESSTAGLSWAYHTHSDNLHKSVSRPAKNVKNPNNQTLFQPVNAGTVLELHLMYSHLFTSPFTCHSQLSATSELAEQLMAKALKHRLQFCKRRTNPMANKQTVQPMGGHGTKAAEE